MPRVQQLNQEAQTVNAEQLTLIQRLPCRFISKSDFMVTSFNQVFIISDYVLILFQVIWSLINGSFCSHKIM